MDHETQRQLGDVLQQQSTLNTAVAKALASLALQADRYDSELAELRDSVLALANRIEAVARASCPPTEGYSMKVQP